MGVNFSRRGTFEKTVRVIKFLFRREKIFTDKRTRFFD